MKKSYQYILLLISFALLSAYTDAQLAREWKAQFGSIKKGTDGGTAITVDDSGYIYVGGYSQRKTTGIDMVVLKYHPDGEVQWTAYYSSGGKLADKALAIAVDTGNNVYVTGTTLTSSNGLDYVTVKFDTSGSLLWSVTYNGTGNGDDVPVAIAVNDSLNVYVTGSSQGSGGTGLDFATVKYDRDGNLVWAKRFTGDGHGNKREDKATAMALRGTEDLYVTGYCTEGTANFLTIKYNAITGDTVWTARYNGPSDLQDMATAIVLRSTSDVFVTGSSQDVANGYDYLTIKYDTAGNEQWVSRYNGNANSDDMACAIAISGTTRVYVTGRSLQVGSSNDIVTVNYNMSTGAEDWVSILNGTANDEDAGVAILGGNNPHVIGKSTGYGVKYDYVFQEIKGSNGDENWNTRYNGSGNADDIPAAIVSSGTAYYITGSTSPDGKTTDILTIKYNDKKKMKFRTFLQDSLYQKGVALKTLAVVPNYGNFRDTSFARAFPKIKSGNPGAPGGMVIGNPRPDSATQYGWMRITKGPSIIKFITHTSAPRGFDTYDGNPFVGEKKDPKLEKYNNKLVGELLALKLNIGASDAEVTTPMFGDLTYEGEDTVGGVVLTGMTLRQIVSLTDNFLTYWQKYPTLEWVKLHLILKTINNSFTGPLKIVNQQPLAFTGAVHIDSVPLFGAPTIAPANEPLRFVPGSLDETPNAFALNQNYPNPFNPTTNFGFRISDFGVVTLKVYDMIGREVATVVNNQTMEEGEYEFSFDGSSLASGVYFYRLTATSLEDGTTFSETKRMLMMK
ncbi:MAG: SBBP repeat-containing protein [Ignavibacteriae bacterium]|nr:SBBP repeat-containing protein [Ignavibacteriota bacterium]